jgi:hypothetical protein
MAKKKKNNMKRTTGQKLTGLKMRVGGIASGNLPRSAAPRTLPGGVKPRIKPVGTVKDKKGRKKLNPNFR